MGKQKTKRKELEGPQVPVSVKAAPIAAIQMTPLQLVARLSKAQIDEELNLALQSSLNYINTLSPDMSNKEFRQNRALLNQLIDVHNAQEEQGIESKLALHCVQKLGEILPAHHLEEDENMQPLGQLEKIEKPMQFQQFGFFQLADLAGMGSVAFGHLPSEQAIYIPEESQAAALDALNTLANANFAGGDTVKAGNDYLDFVEDLASNTWPDNVDAQEAMTCNIISAGPGAGCSQAKEDLQSGNYENLLTDPANPMAEWNNPDSNNYLLWTSKELKLVLSVEAAKALLKWDRGELGIKAKGTVHKETTYSVQARGPALSNREEESKHLPGGGAALFAEGQAGRFKGGASVGVDYVPGKQGGWFIPVDAFGESTMSTDKMSHTLRIQVKASPEATGRAINLEGGVIWNALFFQKADTAVGYVFGVKAARMSTTSDGITNVDLTIEGQLGPTFQKIFGEKREFVTWVGIAGIVQQEIPRGQEGVTGPLPQQTKVGAGFQAGIARRKKAEGFLQIQLNPMAVTGGATDFTGRNEQGEFQGMMFSLGLRFH